MRQRFFLITRLISCFIYANTVLAGEADVLTAEVINEGDARYTFEVTVQHDDTGWDHYADRWEIMKPDGTVIAIRVLRHPHVKEQPFTRRLNFVQIADDIEEVIIRAHCLVDEFGGKQLTVKVPR